MIKHSTLLTLILKELHQHFISFRFFICLILSMVLITASVYYNGRDYSERLREYNASVINSSNDLGKIQALAWLQPKVHRPPMPGSIFVKGIDSSLGTDVEIAFYSVPVSATGKQTANQFATTFTGFDFTDVVIIVLSLLAFLLSYDAISGEKDRGLLRISLANSVPKFQILLAKYIGGMLPLIVSVIAGILISLIIILLIPRIEISRDIIVMIVIFSFTSILFLSFMFLLGLLTSSFTSKPLMSFICVLFLWVLFVFITPRVAQYFGSQFIEVTSLRSIDEYVMDLRKQLENNVSDFSKTIQPQRLNASMTGKKTELGNVRMLTVGGNPPATIEYYRKYHEYLVPLQIDYAQNIGNMRKKRDDELKRQSEVTKMISYISPVSIYTYLAEAIMGTDRINYDRFIRLCTNYREQIIDYINTQGGFSSDNFFMQYEYDPTGEELKRDNEFRRYKSQVMQLAGQIKDDEKLKELQEEYMEKWIEFIQWHRQYSKDHPVEARILDFSEMPVFQFLPSDIRSNIRRSLWSLGTIVILNLFFFLLVNVVFIRYDVR